MSAAGIVMYATDWCPYCERARSLLRAKGAAFEEFDIEALPEKRAEMLTRSGRRTVPQIFIGEGQFVDISLYEAQIAILLEAAGQLDALLQPPR